MKLILVMMVKNESKVIARAIRSVIHLIDGYVIHDTGSEDNTIDIIRGELKEKPGYITCGPFKGFDNGRTHCLDLARKYYYPEDYALVLDADEVIVDGGFDKKYLIEDQYLLKYTGDLDYQYPVIFKLSKYFYYKYPTHEIPMCDEPHTEGFLSTLSINHIHDGGMVHEKYERDIRLIEGYLGLNENDSRMRFYLANSYWDTEKWEDAAINYILRAELGGWDQEVFISYLRAAICYLKLGLDKAFIDTALKACEARADRPDAMYELGKYYNSKNMHCVADIFISKGLSMIYPKDPLFFDRAIFDYLMDIEKAVCMFYLGEHSAAIEYNQAVISSAAPQWAKDLAIKNMEFSIPYVQIT